MIALRTVRLPSAALGALVLALATPAHADLLVPPPQPQESTPASSPASASSPVPLAPVPHFRLHVGAQFGVAPFFGLFGMATFYAQGRPRWDADVLWEPSGYLQSYSVGGAYHIVDSMFFVGARLRLLQLHAPWTRGYEVNADNHLGVGLEAG
ncbi:MAG: hypothetical protein WCJ30_24745, partial [Deltaproteobacteria bacterium]